MNKLHRNAVTFISAVLGFAPVFAAPDFQNVSASGSSIGRYQKIEWQFDLTETYANPYYYYDAGDTPAANAGTPGASMSWFGVDGISVDLHLTSPSGKNITVPAFWFEDYVRVRNSGQEVLGRKSARWAARSEDTLHP